MKKSKKVKVHQGIEGALSGSTEFLTISKNGVIQISKKCRNIAKK